MKLTELDPNKKIKAVLFDSGKVMNGPASGQWFISPKFFDYVDKSILFSLSKEKLEKAFYKAQVYINGEKLIKTVDDELEKFKVFFQIFANEIPELELNKEKIDCLAQDLVFNTKKYVFYDDAIDVIKSLSDSYKIGIVSDAWPSLINVYKDAALYKYFSTFVVSSIIGVTKPNEKIYMTAVDELNIKPENAVFVDDNLNNCNGAVKLGIKALWLCRDKSEYEANKQINIDKDIEVINTLYDITNTKFFK